MTTTQMGDALADVTYRTAAVIIARDEARSIDRCVASVRDAVDEVWVVDTGSVDDTVRLAEAAGAQTGFFAWCNSFAAARNAALNIAGADWHVIIDADEVLISGHEALPRLRHTRPDFVGIAQVVSTFEVDGHRGEEAEQQRRVLPGHVRYEGSVHNQPASGLPTRDLGLVIAHDGYEPEQMARKIRTREQMLRDAVTAHPGDAYMVFQLARNLEIQGRLSEAADLYVQVDDVAAADAGWHHIHVVQTAHVLTNIGRSAEALALLGRHEDRYATSSDFHFVTGATLFDLATQHPRDAHQWVTAARAAWQRALAVGEDVAFIGHVTGRGGHHAQHNIDIADATLAQLE